MSATTVVAIYGASVATAGFGWQVWTHRQSRRPSIRMEVRHAGATADDPDLSGKLIYEVTVAAVNTGETTETVEAIGVSWPEQSCGIDDRPLSEELKPGGVIKRTFPLVACNFDPASGLVPFAEIASMNKRIEGEPVDLEDFLLEKCWPVYAHPGIPQHLR